jgi:hypothetical protein
MNTPNCSYHNHTVNPGFKCPTECDTQAWFWIKDYFRRPKNGTTNLILCNNHAGWWNDTHLSNAVEPIPTKVLRLGLEKW